MDFSSSFECLDNRLLRTFLVAAEKLNFTATAHDLNMTQSGVSQHVKKLEEQLSVVLFQRAGRRVVLTSAGYHLQVFALRQAEESHRLIENIQGKQFGTSGTVKIAMPQSCLTLPEVKSFFSEIKDQRGIELDVLTLEHDCIIDRIENWGIDFGFICQYEISHSLVYYAVAQEELVLVGKGFPQAQGAYTDPGAVYNLIDYPGLKYYFGCWGIKRFGDHQQLAREPYSLVHKASCLRSAIVMVESGLGVSIFPRHCIEKRLAENTLVEIPFESNRPFQNEVYLVAASGRGFSASIERALELLLPKEMQPQSPAFASEPIKVCH